MRTIVVGLLLSCISSLANAEEKLCLPAKQAKEALAAHEALGEVQLELVSINKQIKEYERLIAFKDESISLLQKNVLDQKRIADLWREAANTASDRAQECAKPSLWRNPWFWGVIGLAAGAVGATYIASQ
jgi:hypothetical protein